MWHRDKFFRVYMSVPHTPIEANQTIQDRWMIHHCLKVFASLLCKLPMLPLELSTIQELQSHGVSKIRTN
jgi:hypothetical protein